MTDIGADVRRGAGLAAYRAAVITAAACPRCGAAVGEPCCDAYGGPLRYVHDDRCAEQHDAEKAARDRPRRRVTMPRGYDPALAEAARAFAERDEHQEAERARRYADAAQVAAQVAGPSSPAAVELVARVLTGEVTAEQAIAALHAERAAAVAGR